MVVCGSATGGPKSSLPWISRARARSSSACRHFPSASIGFEIAADGTLSNRRLWAGLDRGVPDGICIDAESAVWYADVPNMRCVRVREGGEVLQTIDLDRGCFACMLGGADRRTLFLVARDWRGPASMTDAGRTGQVLTAKVSTPGAGWP